MQFTVTIERGPFNIELKGESRQELQTELLQLAEFVEDNADTFDSFETLGDPHVPSGTTEDQSSSDSHQQFSDSNGSSSTKLSSLARKTEVNEAVLNKLFQLPSDEDGVPRLNTYHFKDGIMVLGNARNQRQAQASALLLYVWEEALGKKKMKYSQLDDALTSSDVKTERRKDMRSAFSSDAGSWFESDGSSIWLVGQGKNHVRDLINELAEEFEG